MKNFDKILGINAIIEFIVLFFAMWPSVLLVTKFNAFEGVILFLWFIFMIFSFVVGLSNLIALLIRPKGKEIDRDRALGNVCGVIAGVLIIMFFVKTDGVSQISLIYLCSFFALIGASFLLKSDNIKYLEDIKTNNSDENKEKIEKMLKRVQRIENYLIFSIFALSIISFIGVVILLIRSNGFRIENASDNRAILLCLGVLIMLYAGLFLSEMIAAAFKIYLYKLLCIKSYYSYGKFIIFFLFYIYTPLIVAVFIVSTLMKIILLLLLIFNVLYYDKKGCFVK